MLAPNPQMMPRRAFKPRHPVIYGLLFGALPLAVSVTGMALLLAG